MGLPFGAIMAVLYSFQHGLAKGLVAGVVAGLVYGVLMSLILESMHRWAVKRSSSDGGDEALGVAHVRTVGLQLAPDEAFDLCLKALGEIRKSKIQRQDRSRGVILAKAGMTWRSWGDEIRLDAREVGAQRTEVEVSSRPAVRTTLIDYGKNLENVETLAGFLKTHGQRPA